MYILTISTENEMRMVEYDPPHYEILRKAVGGRYENVYPIRLRKPYFMLANEEGFLLNLQLNALGSFLCCAEFLDCPIFGNIAILKAGYYNGEPDAVGMSKDEAKSLGEQFITWSGDAVRWAE